MSPLQEKETLLGGWTQSTRVASAADPKSVYDEGRVRMRLGPLAGLMPHNENQQKIMSVFCEVFSYEENGATCCAATPKKQCLVIDSKALATIEQIVLMEKGML